MEPTKEPSLNLLGSYEFVPEKYVKDLSQNYVGGSELQTLRKKINALLEDTNNNLKKNVYQNYVQFIDTAKEISHLESEMYQLSHLLSEQKSLLNTLSSTSILGEDAPFNAEPEQKENDVKNQEEETRLKLASILEKVEGCKELMDVPGRHYLHEGDLLEIDPTENTVIKTVHVYLFTDCFMITNRNTNNAGLMRHVFEVIYEIGSLAVVNVRDLGNIKHAFKLLIFPDTRVFKCSSNASKKEWLDKIDQAKKTRLVQEQQKRESLVDKSPSRSLSIDSAHINPFDEPEDESFIHPEWFLDVPEELDVCVAQRHFEDALTTLQKAKQYIAQFQHENDQPDQIIVDIQRKVEQRQNNLTEDLMRELEVSPDKSSQGGLRAARRAVRLLNELERSTQACDLFLKLCSSMLKTQCKRVKREGSTLMYVRHLSSVVFTNMCYMSDEFIRAFPNSPACSSAYVVWASGELNIFTTHLIKQVFTTQTSLSTLAECVNLVREQSERLCTYGVDLCYQFDGDFRTPLTKVLKESRAKLIESVKVRANEDQWEPYNLKSKSALARCLQEFADLGLKLDEYVTGVIYLQLTPNTISLTKVFLTLLNDCIKLRTPDLLYTIDEILYDVLDAQVRHYEQSLRNETDNEQRQFIIRNAQFVLRVLIDLAQTKYEQQFGFKCKKLTNLQNEYIALLEGVSPTNRNTRRKYLSTEML